MTSSLTLFAQKLISSGVLYVVDELTGSFCSVTLTEYRLFPADVASRLRPFGELHDALLYAQAVRARRKAQS